MDHDSTLFVLLMASQRFHTGRHNGLCNHYHKSWCGWKQEKARYRKSPMGMYPMTRIHHRLPNQIGPVHTESKPLNGYISVDYTYYCTASGLGGGWADGAERCGPSPFAVAERRSLHGGWSTLLLRESIQIEREREKEIKRHEAKSRLNNEEAES